LDDEVGREVLGPDLASLFLPEADQGLLILPHDDAGIGATDKITPGEICVILLHSERETGDCFRQCSDDLLAGARVGDRGN
jgi:hypothetical protein